MAVILATWLVRVAGGYLLAGIVFAAVFAWRGVGRIDPVARQGSWGFRFVILPGAAALWPYLAWRWLRGAGDPPEECNAHRRAARGAP